MRGKIIALSFYGAYWLALFALSKTLTSGFHWIDEHAVFALHDDIGRGGLFPTIQAYVEEGFSARFRPEYYFQKALQVFFFSDHSVYYYLYNMVSVTITSFCLFWFARKIGIGYALSFLFPLLVFLGPQSEVCYRISPDETPGMLFLSLSLVLCSYAVSSAKTFLYEAGIIFFMLLATLSKESFIIFVPGLIALYLWMVHRARPDKPVREIIAEKMPFIGVLMSICFVELFIIIRYIGTSGNGYAGIDGINAEYIRNAVMALADLFYRNNADFGFFIIAVTGALWLSYRYSTGKRSEAVKFMLWEVLPLLVILAVILTPQIALYMKSKMLDRYLLPSVFGIAFVAVYLAHRLIVLGASRVISFLLIAFISLTVFKKTLSSFNQFRSFASECAAVNEFWSEIKASTEPGSNILFVSDPVRCYEFPLSMSNYFRSDLNNRRNYYFHFIDHDLNKVSAFHRTLIEKSREMYGRRLDENNTSLQYEVIGMPLMLDGIPGNPDLPLGKFQRRVIGNQWVVYKVRQPEG